MTQKKKIYIVCIVCFISFIVGIILWGLNDTPYHVEMMWLETEPVYSEEYIFAKQNIVGKTIGYFGGISLMVISPIIAVLNLIKNFKNDKEKIVQDNMKDLID